MTLPFRSSKFVCLSRWLPVDMACRRLTIPSEANTYIMVFGLPWPMTLVHQRAVFSLDTRHRPSYVQAKTGRDPASLGKRVNGPRIEGTCMNDNHHPRGALVFILVYLLMVVFLWTHTYLRLWLKG